jgi:uncharacterized protein (DUF2147 family)
MVRLVCLIIAALLAATSIGAQSPTPVGVWFHPNKRIQVEISRCGERLCGKMVWFRWPNDAQGLPLVDINNPDPALRSRPLLGLRILHGLRPAGERTWEGGRIYNPDDGVSYQARMTIGDDGSLHVRAYVLLPILGKTLVWTRVR